MWLWPFTDHYPAFADKLFCRILGMVTFELKYNFVEDNIMENKHVDRRLWLGVGAILLGLIFLANNFGILDYQIRRYLLRWEVLLIFLGLVFIVEQRKRTTGIILLVIGGAFYLRDILHYSFNFWELFWPALLILVGLMIIFRHRLDRDWRKDAPLSDNIIDEIAIFGGGDRVVSSQQFQGGKVTTVFGGLNYNMLKAKLAPGENYIDVFCLFGGMKLVVPEGWKVKIQVMSLFGGFSDKHRFRSSEASPDTDSQLIIKGTVIFGGGEIKSFFD
jgi:predicted membrane protein